MNEADELKTLRIEGLAQGGDGLAREAAQPIVFVRGTAPGDLVRARLAPSSAAAPQFRRATLVEILEPGPGRRAAPCPEAHACGGCQWQHVKDESQDEIIRELLLTALRRVGKLAVADDVVAPAVGLPARLGYRQRVRVHVDERVRADREERPALGFLRAGSHDVHPVARCPVAERGLQDMTARISARLPDLARAMRQFTGQLQLDLPEDGVALASLENSCRVTREELLRGLETLAEICPEIVAAEALGAPGGRGKRARARLGPRSVEYRRGPLEDPRGFVGFASPGGFLQASRAGNSLLISRVLAAARSLDLPSGARLLELFAGDGNFSVPVAAAGFDVLASDSDERAVENATLALRHEALRPRGNLRVEQARADAHVQRLAQAGERFDVVLLDPPRSGAREACELLPRLGARAIIMVSCDAATLARDVGILSRAGYALQRAEPLAIFPQTAHFESVALLTR